MSPDTEKLTDAQLLERYAAGDEAAFREIVNRYKNGLYVFLKRFLNQTDAIENVFQATFLQLFNSRDSFELTDLFVHGYLQLLLTRQKTLLENKNELQLWQSAPL